MVEDDQASAQGHATWRRRAVIALGVFCALLLIFHRPLLLRLGEGLAVHFAARENLKLTLRLEGTVFTSLTARNLHVIATGPTDIESIDADFVRIDYNPVRLLRRGLINGLRNVELRSARIVLNPARARIGLKTPPKRDEKTTLP